MSSSSSGGGGGGTSSGELTAKWAARLAAFEELTLKWRQAGLAALQRTALPANAATLTTTRDALAQERKELSAVTKAFSRLPAEERAAEVPALLKRYQTHIDDVTKGLKRAERAFFGLHDFVGALRDPVPMMEKFSREKATILEFVRSHESLSTLRVVLAEREAELTELKNQEVTIMSLREQLASAEVDAVRGRESEEASDQLRDVLHEWHQRERAMQEQLVVMSQECRGHQVRAAELATQLAAAHARAEEATVAAEQEAEGLLRELADAQVARKVLEQHVADMRVAAPAAVPPTEATLDAPSGAEAAQQERVAAEAAQQERVAEAAAEATQARLTEQLHAASQELQAARDAIAAEERRQRDVAEELASLRATAKSCENRANAADAELQGARAEAAAHSSRAAELQAANARLEVSLQATERELRELVQQRADGGEAAPMPEQRPRREQQPLDEMAAAIAAQRDSYRQRLFTLEEVAAREAERLRGELTALRHENAMLLQSASSATAAAASSGGGGGGLARDPSSTAMLESQHRAVRIGAILENSRVGAVPEFLDRAAVLLARFVLANQTTRRVFLAYLVGVHTLVMVVLLERFLTDT